MSDDAPIVAERQLQIVGTGNIVTVLLRSPRPHPEGDWECSFTISGLATPVSDSAYGVDAMQALMLALEGIRLALEAAPETFSWEGEEGDAGFPRFIPKFFGPEFSAHVGRLLDTELLRFSEQLEQRYNQNRPKD